MSKIIRIKTKKYAYPVLILPLAILLILFFYLEFLRQIFAALGLSSLRLIVLTRARKLAQKAKKFFN